MNTNTIREGSSTGLRADQRPVILITSYGRGAVQKLGTAGYSYDFVAKLFRPLLAELGEVLDVSHPERDLAQTAERVAARGRPVVHVCFRAFQDMLFAPGAMNVAVPAWEFPDVPDHPFDGNPQNDWVATANRCDLVIVGGPFTRDIFQRAGIRTPIQIVPVPSPDEYFDAVPWSAVSERSLPVACFDLVNPSVEPPATVPLAPPADAQNVPRLRGRLRQAARQAYIRGVRPLIPPVLNAVATRVARRCGLGAGGLPPARAYPRMPRTRLSGIVYTSIFNPMDGRKNYQDLISGFLTAFRDCPDATLVLKLATQGEFWLNMLLGHYRRLDVPHACRLVVITDFLSDDQMLDLLESSTFYVTTTRAEGSCLPLMNYLAGGRPAISTCHTAIADYFDQDLGWVVDSHPEPAAWPHDSRLRYRTTWHRLVWPSLVEQFQASYRMVKENPAAYRAVAQAAHSRMANWCRPAVVQAHLDRALAGLLRDEASAGPANLARRDRAA